MCKTEVITRLCILASKVGEKAFNNRFAHDCICKEEDSHFQFEEPVLRFIECAVEEALAKKQKEG